MKLVCDESGLEQWSAGKGGGMKKRMKKYLRRNALLAKACGVRAAIVNIRSRWTKRPNWAQKMFEAAYERQMAVIEELTAYRDKVSPYKEKEKEKQDG